MEELLFKYIELRPEVAHPTKAMLHKRDGAHVLVRDKFNHWVLAHKLNYPEGTAKAVGGGIEDGEGPLQAIIREMREETGVDIDEDRLVPLVHVGIFEDGKEEASFDEFVFYCAVSQPMTAGDDVADFVELDDQEMARLLARMANLPETAVREGSEATWNDWGKVWGPIHAAALERVKEMGI